MTHLNLEWKESWKIHGKSLRSLSLDSYVKVLVDIRISLRLKKGARRDDNRAEDTVRAGPFIYPYILVITPFSRMVLAKDAVEQGMADRVESLDAMPGRVVKGSRGEGGESGG